MSGLVPWLNQAVLVRSRDSGVWVGTLEAWEGSSVRLSEARRIWSWRSGAGECSQIAAGGVTKGKIGPPGPVLVLGCCELHPMQPAAVEAVGRVEVWRG